MLIRQNVQKLQKNMVLIIGMAIESTAMEAIVMMADGEVLRRK